jgi:O-antigen ligase
MALLAWGTLAFGAVYPWAYWPLFGASAALGVWGLVATKGWTDPRVRRLLYALTGLAAAIGVQLIALPGWLVARLSPGVDRFFRAFEVGYLPASLHALTLDPPATAANLAEAIALGLLLLGTTRVLRLVRVDWLASQLMGLGVAIATIGILQKALGPPDHVRVYGFWQPIQGGNPFGPFVNRNHFAGWMAMTIPVVAAYAWALRQSGTDHESGVRGWVRWGSSVDGNRFLLVATATVIMAVAVVLTQSRSGMVSLAIALMALGWVVARRVASRTRRLLAVTYLLLILGVAVAWAGTGPVIARFHDAPGHLSGRLSAWRDTVHIVSDFPIFGTGIGAYRRAMLVYQTSGRELMYAEAHNDYLQLVAEGGVLVLVPALAVLWIFAVGVRHRLVSPDDEVVTCWVRRGAVAGLVGIAAQSLVEFSLQMPGNATLFVVLAAIALHRPRTAIHANRV